MAEIQDKASDNTGEENPTTTQPSSITIDPTALAGSKNSLGAESVRDGRPATCDDVVEAMDEEGPGITAPLDAEKAGR